MRKQRRDRHTLKQDRDKHLSELEEQNPGQKAREWMHRPAYYNCQAGKLVRDQGRQMEHKDVIQYLRDRGVIRVGQENAETVPGIKKRGSLAGGQNK